MFCVQVSPHNTGMVENVCERRLQWVAIKILVNLDFVFLYSNFVINYIIHKSHFMTGQDPTAATIFCNYIIGT